MIVSQVEHITWRIRFDRLTSCVIKNGYAILNKFKVLEQRKPNE